MGAPSIPPIARQTLTGTSLGAFLAWMALTLVELQTGQARIEQQVVALDARMNRAQQVTKWTSPQTQPRLLCSVP